MSWAITNISKQVQCQSAQYESLKPAIEGSNLCSAKTGWDLNPLWEGWLYPIRSIHQLGYSHCVRFLACDYFQQLKPLAVIIELSQQGRNSFAGVIPPSTVCCQKEKLYNLWLVLSPVCRAACPASVEGARLENIFWSSSDQRSSVNGRARWLACSHGESTVLISESS